MTSLTEQEPIKIAYIIGSLQVGGTERQLVELIKGLDKNQFTPFLCCMFAGGPLEKALEEVGVEVKIFNFIGLARSSLSLKFIFYNLRMFLRLIVYLKRLKPTILHSNLKLNNLFGATAAKLVAISYIVVGYRNLIDETERYPLLSRWERKVNDFANVITVNSEGVKQALIQRLNSHPQKIRVLHNGVDLTRFQIQKPDQLIIGNLSLPTTELIITIIANLIPYKGHEDFIEAINLVYEKNPNIKCLFVGRDDGFGSHLSDVIHRLGLQDSVVFAGPLSNIPEILGFTDIQVLASHHEGFANVILEGMAGGVPLVVTDVGGNVEAVVDGETGFVVPPKNPEAMAKAILKLLEDENLRKRMGQAGRLRVEKLFSLESMVCETEKFYKELLGLAPIPKPNIGGSRAAV